MEKVKLYGETYEMECGSCDAYSLVNNGGSETSPYCCPFCGSGNFDMREVIVESK